MVKKLQSAITADELKKKLEPDPEIIQLRDDNSRLMKTIDGMRKAEGFIKAMTHSLKSIVPIVEPLQKYYKPISKPISKPVTAVLHITDWHWGAHQEAFEIEGIGSYNREIAKDRIFNKLIPNVLDWVEMNRNNYTVEELVILSTGDSISGDIHRELSVTNECPCPQQAVEVGFAFADMVVSFASHFSNIRVEFITVDNHGRLTTRPQAKEAGFNNYGYVVAELAKERLKLHDNVIFNVLPMAQKVVPVSNKQYLILHGDAIMGWAGYPYYGIDRKSGKEALKRMKLRPEIRPSVRYDLMVMGHFHAPLIGEDWVIGGSLSGTDAYDHKQGRHSEPKQLTWLVHPEHGEFNWTKWVLN